MLLFCGFVFYDFSKDENMRELCVLINFNIISWKDGENICIFALIL